MVLLVAPPCLVNSHFDDSVNFNIKHIRLHHLDPLHFYSLMGLCFIIRYIYEWYMYLVDCYDLRERGLTASYTTKANDLCEYDIIHLESKIRD